MPDSNWCGRTVNDSSSADNHRHADFIINHYSKTSGLYLPNIPRFFSVPLSIFIQLAVNLQLISSLPDEGAAELSYLSNASPSHAKYFENIHPLSLALN